MKTHYDLTDDEFEICFENGIFPAECFDHDAHLRLAWIHINKYGINKAIDNVNNQILNFVTTLGARDKYNKTLTTAALHAVHHLINRSSAKSLNHSLLRLPD